MELKIKVFTIQEFCDFNQNYRKQNLKEDIHYFDYNDMSTSFTNQKYIDTCRFIVAYNDKKILGISKIASYENSNNQISISYLSVNKKFLNNGISKILIEETIKVVKEFNMILGSSEYSVDGWKYLRKYLIEYCDKYDVKLIDNVVGYPGLTGCNDEFYELVKESKKIICEKHPEFKDRYYW